MKSETYHDTLSYLVTGAAGFIGFHLSKKLLDQGCRVIGVDNINNYYDVNLKYARLEQLITYEDFIFNKGDISDKDALIKIFQEYKPDIVINLAAQAGVRYSLTNPDAYMESNVMGFYHILEACKLFPVKHLLYASSSSVYGANKKVPFEEMDFVDNPVSLYAATKKSNELMAFTYSHLFGIPTTGLRFFTVYGPLGRPDMAYFSFTDHYFKGEPISIFNNGDIENDLYRDFTYIDDIVESILKLIEKPPVGEPSYQLFNIGNNNPEKLMSFINTLEKALTKAVGKEIIFKKVFEPLKEGDVARTFASTQRLQEVIDFKPKTSIADGLQMFADWYVDYYQVKSLSAEEHTKSMVF